jgi:hypothetical protein
LLWSSVTTVIDAKAAEQALLVTGSAHAGVSADAALDRLMERGGFTEPC